MNYIFRLIILVGLLLSFNYIHACDETSATINSLVDNLNGTYTTTIEVCTEYNGLEGSPDELFFSFNLSNPTTINVLSFSPPSYFTTSGDEYVGTITNNELNYATSELFPGNSNNTLCNTFTITLDANPSSVYINVHPDFPSAVCEYNLDYPPPPCDCGDPSTDCPGAAYPDEPAATAAYNGVTISSPECTDVSAANLSVETPGATYTFCYEYTATESNAFAVNSQVAAIDGDGDSSCQDNSTLTIDVYELGDCSTPLVSAGANSISWDVFSFTNGQTYEICTTVDPAEADCCGVVEAVCTYVYPNCPPQSYTFSDATCVSPFSEFLITPNGSETPDFYLFFNTATGTIESTGGVTNLGSGNQGILLVPFIIPDGNYDVYISDIDLGGLDLTSTFSLPDASSCFFQANIDVSYEINTTITPTQSDCNGIDNGSITVSTAGGSGNYSYAWNDGSIGDTATPTGLSTGTYTVTVTDTDSGCINVLSTTIICSPCSIESPTANDICASTVCGNTPAGDYFLELTFDNLNENSSFFDIYVDGNLLSTATFDASGTTTACIDDSGFDSNNEADIEVVITDNGIVPTHLTSINPACTGCMPTTSGFIINEVSQGESGNQDWFELLVTGNSYLNADGWAIDDVNTGGYIFFETSNSLACSVLETLAPGAIVLVYNGDSGERDPNIPPDDLFDSNGDGVYIYPHDNICFELCNNNTFPCGSVSTGGFFTSFAGFAATNDGAQTFAPNGNFFHGVHWGSPSVTPNPNSISLTTNDNYTFTCGSSAEAANFSSDVETTRTPGAPNNANNLLAINQLNNSACYTCFTYDEDLTDPVVDSIVPVDETCPGSGNGSIDLTVSGGATPYTFSWDNGAGTVEDPSSLSGTTTYTVTVTDANGCTITSSATVNAPSTLTASIAPTDESCDGNDDGSLTFTLTGTGPFDLSGDINQTGVNDGFVEVGLADGTYNVTVTDANGCTASTTAAINSGSTAGISIAPTDESCDGNDDGSLTFTLTGTGPFDLSGDINQTGVNDGFVEAGLADGTYNVTVTDANGCTASTTADIDLGGTASIVINNVDDVSCDGGNNGAITYTVNGADPIDLTGDLVLAGIGNGVTNLAPSLSSGTYNLTITDANGCTATTSTTIGAGSTISIGIAATNESCDGNNDGSLTFTLTGTGPFDLSGDINQTSVNDGYIETDVADGAYNVTVTDASGCTASASATINTGNAPSISIAATNESCNANDDGSLTFTLTGTGPFDLSGDVNQTGVSDGFVETGLADGTYNVTVTDANGCTASTTADITAGSTANISITPTNESCAGNDDGSLTFTLTGTGPFDLSGDVNQTGVSDGYVETNVADGTYNITVTDASGCTASASTVVDTGSNISVSIVATNEGCDGATDGTLTFNLTGTAPFDITGDINATGLNDGYSAINLADNTYDVTVTDASGCTASASATVAPGAFASQAAIVGFTRVCAGGTTTLTAIGGTSFLWDDGTSSADITVGPGTYSVTVGSGICASTASVTVTEDPSDCCATTVYQHCVTYLDALVETDRNDFSLTTLSEGYLINFPPQTLPSFGSPTLSGVDVNIDILSINDATDGAVCDLLSVYGNVYIDCGLTDNCSVIQDVLSVGCGNFGTGTAAVGDYTLDLLSCGGAAAAIDENTILGVDIVPAMDFDFSSCVSNGSAISDGLVDIDFVVCIEYTYDLTSDIDVSVVATDETCAGDNSGSITFNLDGLPPFDISGDVTATDVADGYVTTGLGSGNYNITVTDDTGCTASANTDIIAGNEVLVDLTATDELCAGDNDGAITFTLTGAAPFDITGNINASGINSGYIQTALSVGDYNITVTDNNGCSATASTSVAAGSTPSIAPDITNESCLGENDGLIVFTLGGIAPYNLSGDITTTGTNSPYVATDLSSGDYNVTITDANGCTASTSATINAGLAVPSINIVDNECAGGDYTFTVELTGDTSATYDLTGSAVTGGNPSSITTDASGFGTASFTLPLTQATASIIATLNISPNCNSGATTINAPDCNCPTVNNASGTQALCHNEAPDLSDATTGFNIISDPNGNAGIFVWTTNGLSPDAGGTTYTPASPLSNQTCAVATTTLSAWLACTLDDSWIAAGTVTINVYPDAPTANAISNTLGACSGESGIVTVQLLAADGSICATQDTDALTNTTCQPVTGTTFGHTFTVNDIETIFGAPAGVCSYTDQTDNAAVDVYPTLTVNTTGSGACGNLVAELVAENGTTCNSTSLTCGTNSDFLDYDFTADANWTAPTGCPLPPLTGSLACAGCICNDPTLVEAGTLADQCSNSNQPIDLTAVGASISGSVNNGTWSSSGDGTFDGGTNFSTATTYTPSANDIANGTLTLTLTSDIPTDPLCSIESDNLVINFLPATLDINETYVGCEGDNYEYTSPSGTVYNEANPTGNETITDANGCDYTVTVDLIFNPLTSNIIENNVGCQGDGYEFTSPSGVVYNELNPTGFEILSDANSCNYTVTVDLIFNPATPDINENYNGCEGDNYEYTSPSGTVYNEANPVGTETLTDANGCDYTVTVDLTFNPVTTDIDENYIGCQGDNYEYVSPTGTVYNEANPTGNETVADANGCDYTVNVNLIYNALPTLTLISANCIGDLSTYDIVFDSDGSVVSSIGTTTGNTITGIPSGTDVTLIATSTDGCSSELSITAPDCSCPSINPPVSSGNTTICVGDLIPTLSVTVDAGNQANWYQDAAGTVLLATGNDYTPSSEGTYYVQAEEISSGCVSLTLTPITISNYPTTPTENITNIACAGDGFEYVSPLGTVFNESNPTGSELLTDANGCTYNLVVDLTYLPSTDDILETYNGCTGDGYVYVSPSGVTYNQSNPSGVESLSDANGCPYTVTVDLTFNTVIPDINENYIGCTGDGYTFTSPSGVVYDESNPIGNETLTDLNGCEYAVNVNLTFNPVTPDINENYIGCTGDGYFFTSPSGITYNEINPTGNEVLTDFGGCTYAVNVNLTFNPLPSLSLISAACVGDLSTYDIEFDSDSAVVTSVGTLVGNTVIDIPTGTNVTLTATDANGCISSLEVTAPDCSCPSINPPISGGDIAICDGDAIPTLSVTVDVGNQANWYGDAAGTVFLATGDTYTPTAEATFYVQAEEISSGCISSTFTPVTLSVNSSTADILETYDGCSGDAVEYISPSGIVYNEANPTGSETLVNASGCEYTVTVDFVFNPLPSLDVINVNCVGDLTTYEVTFNSDGTVVASAGTVVGNLVTGIPADTDITLTATNANACISTIVITAPDCDCPVIAAPVSNGDVSVCNGDPLPTLSVSVDAGNQANWYEDAAGTIFLATGDTFTPSSTGIYYVQAEEIISGCTSLTLTPVNLSLFPTTPDIEETYNGCIGDGYEYIAASGVVYNEANPTGTETLTDANGCEYIQNINLIFNDLTPDITEVHNGCVGDGYEYISDAGIIYNEANPTGTETLTDANGCEYTLTVNLVFNPLPAITLVSSSCSPDLTTYSIEFSSTSTVTASIGNLAGSIVSDIPAGTNVSLTATDADGCETVLDINAPDCDCPSIAAPISDGDMAICDGDAIPALSVTVDVGNQANWYEDAAGTILLTTGDTYTPITAGTFYVQAEEVGSGCTSLTLTPVTLVINSPTIDESVNETACSGDGFEYVSPLGTVFNEANPTGTEILTDANGCNYTLSVNLTFETPPSATVTSNTNTCSASTDGNTIVDFNALITAGATNGTWEDTDGTGVDLTTDLANVDFDGLAVGSYTFTYILTAASPCTDQSYTTTISIQDCACPLILINPVDAICNDTDFDLSTLLDPVSEAGSWNITSTPTGSNPASITGTTLVATNADGGNYELTYTLDTPVLDCPESETIIVTVNATPTATVSPTAEICNDGTILDIGGLIANVQNATGSSLQDNDATGVSLGDINAVDFDGITPGTYTFTYILTGSVPCNDAVYPINIMVNDCSCTDPATIDIIADNTEICSDESVLLTATLGGNASSVTWTSSGDGNFDDVNSLIPSYTPGSSDISSGSITLTATTDDADGTDGPCVSATTNISINIDANEFAVPTFAIGDSYCVSDAIPLLPTTSDNGIEGIWQPEFIDVTTPNTQNYTFTPIDGQCAETYTISIAVDDCSNVKVLIPNAFSPNNDGINDVFRLQGVNVETVELLIFDRWGQTIFEADITDLSIGWDGTYKGIDQEIGVYVYYANVSFTDGSSELYKGNVSLIR